MELFKGSLHYRCALSGFEETYGHPSLQSSRRTLYPLLDPLELMLPPLDAAPIDAAPLDAAPLEAVSPQLLLKPDRRLLGAASAAAAAAAAAATAKAIAAAAAAAADALGDDHRTDVNRTAISATSIATSTATSAAASTAASTAVHVGARLLKGGGGKRTSFVGQGVQAPYDTGVTCRTQPSSGFGACPAGTSCKYFDENPSHGLNSFDSVALVAIVFIQAVTFDDWATPMYDHEHDLMGSVSPFLCNLLVSCRPALLSADRYDLMAAFSPLVWIYFILIVMVAGFFVVNLYEHIPLPSPRHSVTPPLTSSAPSPRLLSSHPILTFLPSPSSPHLPLLTTPLQLPRRYLSRVWQRSGANQGRPGGSKDRERSFEPLGRL